MRPMPPLAAAVVLIAVAHAQAARSGVERRIFVSTKGSDADPGTREQPLGSLTAARNAARKIIAARVAGRIAVVIRGGRYHLAEPLTLGPQDSAEGVQVNYAAAEGETVVVSGGRPITGWRRGQGQVWTAAVPEAKAGKWWFRNLWVHGRRAVRARFPNRDAKDPRIQLQDARLSKDLKTFTLKFAPGFLEDWKSPADIEVFIDGNWAINRKRFQSIDPKAGTVHLAPPHRQSIPWNRPRRGRWCYLESAREFLDQPGEWYLDRKTGVLSYWPLPGEDMAKADVVAPVLTRLLEVKGTKDTPVRNLHFIGISFEHTHWDIPEVGYFGVQACHHVGGTGEARAWSRVPAAIRWDYVENSSVRDGRICHLGGTGIALVEGCHRNVIEGNHVFDISANGAMLGGPKDEPRVPRDNRITNNHVHACGIDFHGAVGIWVGFAQRAVLAHNRVHDLPYTGISLGWQWNPQPTPCRENRIELNHIFDCMRHLGDGGGIYTLGFQPGTVIRGNHIHDIRRSRFAQAAPNNGMFIDEGSKGFLFERNVIYSTAHQIVRFNQCRREWHTWKDNHFGGGAPPVPGKIGTALRCDGSSSFLEAPHKPVLDPEQLTVEAWIRLAELPAGSDPRRWIVNKNRNEWIEGHYALMIDGDKVGAYLNIGGGRDNMHGASSPEGALKPNAWHHAAMTYDGKDLEVYLDGRPVASKAINKKRTPGRSPLAIGRRQDAYNYFKGAIDDVRIYSRALSADEIKAHHSAPKPIADPKAEKALAGYWPFDDLAKPRQAIQAIIDNAGLESEFRKRLLGDE